MRRWAALRLHGSLLPHLFSGGHHPEYYIPEGLPLDTEIVAVTWNAKLYSVEFTLSSSEFADIPDETVKAGVATIPLLHLEMEAAAKDQQEGQHLILPGEPGWSDPGW